MDSSKWDSSTEGLRIGDLILLRDVLRGGYLSAEGILLEDAVLGDGNLHDAIFCVHLQRQYSASRDLQAFLQRYHPSISSSSSSSLHNHTTNISYQTTNSKTTHDTMMMNHLEDESAEKYLLALKRGRENEKKLNDTYMKKKYGQLVTYGDIIQLYHIRSGKYLTIIPDQLAFDERENTRVQLDSNGSSYSWLTITPRFKIDKEGDRLLHHAEVFLKVTERANEFLHVSERDSMMLNSTNSIREVNCALEATSWKIGIYQRAYDIFDKTRLLASELVYLVDPETNSGLMVSPSAIKYGREVGNSLMIRNEENSSNKQRKKIRSDKSVLQLAAPIVSSTPSSLHLDDLPTPTWGAMSNTGGVDGDSSGVATPGGGKSLGDIVLEPMSTETVNSNFLWFLDTASLVTGGPILWRTEVLRLRHMNTGRYLSLKIVVEPEDESSDAHHLIRTTDSHDAPETLLSVYEFNSTGRYLTNGKPIQMGHGGIWLERGDIMDGTVFTYEVNGTRDKNKALKLIIQRYSERNNHLKTVASLESDDAVRHQHEPLDVFSSLSARKWLTKYCDMIVVPNDAFCNTIWPDGGRSDLEIFRTVAEKTVYFSQGFPISSTNLRLEYDKGDIRLRQQRQSLLREQGILAVVLIIIEKLIPMTDKYEKAREATSSAVYGRSSRYTEEQRSALVMAQTVLSHCFSVIFYSILGSHENQMYVADYMPILLAHLNVQPLAGRCVTEMLSKNMELQETKIGTREIQIFVNKLRSSKMNMMYLQLLQACCSCQGEGVDGNQYKVASLLFGESNDAIVQLHADDSSYRIVQWGTPGLYIPSNLSDFPMLGDNLLRQGLPQLSVTWTTGSIEFSPLGLFGKLSVSLEELFGVDGDLDDDAAPTVATTQIGRVVPNGRGKNAGGQSTGGIAKLKVHRSKTHEQRKAVRDYFVAQLFLAAEMCLDRNYVAMHKLDGHFPYDLLVSILKLDLVAPIKAAATRLLMCLHVDRDPQAESKIPCLTRTWSDIKRNTEPKLPYVDSSQIYMFGLLQQIISEHIRGMAGRRWDVLSNHMLKLLRSLVRFNFYGTPDRLKDMIGPLIAALDRRSVDMSDISARSRPVSSKLDASASSSKLDSVEEVSKALDQEAVLARENSQRSQRMSDDEHLSGNLHLIDGKRVEASKRVSLSNRHWLSNTVSSIMQGLIKFYNFNKSAARAIALLDDANVKPTAYVVPVRYSKAPIYELETMVEIVDILAFAQRVIEDCNISLLLRYFYLWESEDGSRSPAELFEQVVVDSRSLTLNTADFDNIMIDTLMFDYAPLVQSALEVLMAHHSMRRTLLENAKSVQLLASPNREKHFRVVEQRLKQLEQNAETHELWGQLRSETDRSTNNQTMEILNTLIEMCRIRRQVLEFDSEFMADVEIQDLFRNLGLFGVAMKILARFQSIDPDVDESDADRNTRALCRLANDLLYWFVLGNEKNQELGYQEIAFFLSTLDSDLNSHLVVRALFVNNERLMRTLPHTYLTSLLDRLVKGQLSHHYLTLFAAITHVGEKNIVENQFEIVKLLTSPGILRKLSIFLVPSTHLDFSARRDLMKPFLGKKNLSLEDLPPILAYHLLFLDILSGCTVGRMNVTAVEAKVQSVLSYSDLVDSILDPGTIPLARLIFIRFLFNAFIEVELIVPGLERSYAIWRLLESFQAPLRTAKAVFNNLMSVGWADPSVDRQQIEYIVMCIYIIRGFFAAYYDSGNFQVDAPRNVEGSDRFTQTYVNNMMVSFFNFIREIADINPPHLSVQMRSVVLGTLDVLRKLVHRLPNAMTADLAIDKRMEALMKSNEPLPIDKDAQRRQGSAVVMQAEYEQNLIIRYRTFLAELETKGNVLHRAENESVAFIRILERLPFIADPVGGDVRYETLIRKLVFHIRESLRTVNGQKRLDARVTRTSTWIIRAFRTMIENRMGMSIFERDTLGGEAQDIAAAPVVNALNSCGATTLCLDLICDGIDEKLQLEAMRLGVALLFKEGGAHDVQVTMHRHLSKGYSELFFRQVRLTLTKLQSWHTWHQVIIIEKDAVPDPPDAIILIRLLQLMCEGHYLPNQDLIREQPLNRSTYNLLDDVIAYLNCLSRLPCRTNSYVAIHLASLVLELIQGPCEKNQRHFALNTELIETLNRINRAKLDNDCEPSMEITLKNTAISICRGLLEGQGESSVVYERLLSVIHLDIIQRMSCTYIFPTQAHTESAAILRTSCVVLLQMFCNYRPALYEELGISRRLEDIVGSGTAMIEVIWRGDIHRRFFHVPAICQYLASSSRDALVENVDRSSAENKLIDFLSRAQEMYREVKHQQLLTHLGLAHIFSRENQNRATWITFTITIVINSLFLADYSFRNGRPEISPLFDFIAQSLNFAQAGVASFTLLLWLVVRSPVNYQSFASAGLSPMETILYTATDPLTVYYIIYLVISFLGVVQDNFYCALLLLDIVVKNSTTRDLLNAIVTPHKQLAMALVFMVFVIYIYAFFIFFFYREDIVPYCSDLWSCMKTTLSYGLQNGGGIADSFEHTTGWRLFLDLTFFCIVLVVLLNVFLGMIIDTFSSLRAEKIERLRDTRAVCFICGIEKQVFDRSSDQHDGGFRTHVQLDHNMWNYLYFIFMLWEQDRDEDDGLEQYIRRAIEAEEITWFPLNKAMRLDRVATGAEILRSELMSAVDDVECSTVKDFEHFSEDVNSMLHGLMASLRQEQGEDQIAHYGHNRLDFMHDSDEDEPSDNDSHTVGSANLNDLDHTTENRVRKAVVSVDGVVGLTLDPALGALSVRFSCDDTVHTVQSVSIDNSSVSFGPLTRPFIVDHVQPTDKRTVEVTIIQGDPSRIRIYKPLGVVQLSVLELITSTHKTIPYTFVPLGGRDVATITLSLSPF